MVVAGSPFNGGHVKQKQVGGGGSVERSIGGEAQVGQFIAKFTHPDTAPHLHGHGDPPHPHGGYAEPVVAPGRLATSVRTS